MSLDEDLQARAEEDQRRQEEFEAQQQEDRLQQQQAEMQRQTEQNQGVSALKQEAKQQVKKVAKKAIWEFLAATWEIWVPGLLIIAGIIVILFVVIGVPVAVCNSNYFDSIGTGTTKAIFTASGICTALKGGQSGGGGGGASFGGKLTDAEARAQFTAAGIGWNALQPQTSFEGIFQATVTEVISLKNGCDAKMGNCTVIVTGGTESGHASGVCSHGTGYKFDVRLNDKLTNYVKTTFTPSGTRSDGAALYTNSGSSSIYALEGDHWDVAVGCNSTNE